MSDRGIIDEMVTDLWRMALVERDFDWGACAPGMRAEFVERGGDGTVPDWIVAASIRHGLRDREARSIMTRVRPERREMETPKNPDSIVPDRVRENTCRWQSLISWARATGAEFLVEEVECVACHKPVAIVEAQTTVAVGVHGDLLPIPGYVHCPACMLRMDATHAWLLAHAEARRAIGRRA